MTSFVKPHSQIAIPLPGYTFVEPIHQGTRTTVYRAMTLATQQPVVIKILSQEYPSFSELVQFRNQYTITQNLPIAGIVRSLSLEPCGNGYGLIMEDFGEICLAHYAEQHPPGLGEILDIAIQLATVLHELHQHRVIHKDIKPTNILIHPDSKQVRLIDFSIASLLPKETQAIQSPQSIEGTLAYLAPEQTGRMNRTIDYRTDFYALGVTLYQLLTGRLPFTSEDPLALIHSHMALMPTAVDQLNPDVPAMVAAIVEKLMAKNAEDRYQSAFGLKYDLEQCRTQWQDQGRIAEFALRQRDLSDRFFIPEKLYGREAEVRTLLDAFDRVSQGASELMLVAGFSGIGKTAVVNEVHTPIVRQRGYFIKGKFDQFKRNIPFSAFVQAFQDLVGQLLSESDAELQRWRTQILDALGENAQVIVDLIPELARIVGPQPAAPELSGTAAQNRFNLLFQRFIHVFTTSAHPLVMFVDDLQWADSASLHLIQVLMTEAKAGHLLLLGAYRDNEVSPTHPLMLTLDSMGKTGATVQTITLQPLSFISVNRLVADTLYAPEPVVRPLTELVVQKTRGNPFFATQFLKALHQDRLIRFDHNVGYWQCDLVQIQDAALTDDVVEFMVQQLQKLPTSTQQILKLAACIGAQFDLATLAIVSEQSQVDAATALWKALQEGLILPQSEIYKFYLGESVSALHHPPENLNYKFLHDRVQQAAYSLIADDQKQSTHLTMGRLLLNNSSQQEREERLFEIVNHLNIGIDVVTQLQERDDLAKLNLAVGRKAKAATAYSAAIAYLSNGIDLLLETAWDNNYALMLALHEEITEASYLNTDFEQMERWADVVLQRAKTLLDTIKVQQTRIMGTKAQGQLLDAITIGLQVLNTLGIEFPEQPTSADIDQAFGVTQALWADKPPMSLLDLPAMEDPLLLATMEILTVLVSAAYIAAPHYMPLLVFKQVELSIRFGNSPVSVFSYADYGLTLSSVIGDWVNGYEFGELALCLLDKLQVTPYKCRCWYIVHTYIKHWNNSLSDMLAPLQEAYHSGLETGDIESLSLNAVAYCCCAYYSGHDLADLAETMEAYRQTVIQYKQTVCIFHQEIAQQTVLNLLGQSPIPHRLTGDIFNQENSLPQLKATNQRPTLFFWYMNQTRLAYLFEQMHEAIQFSAETVQYLDGSAGGFSTSLYPFYDALIQLSQAAEATAADRQAMLLKVQDHQTQLQDWAALAPMNHQHRWELVEAERCRVLGHKIDAIEAYDRAIAGAKESGFIQDEALANELVAKFYLSWDKERVAAGYMQEAYYCYSRWGARAKVTDLEARYSDLLRPILQPSASVDVLNTLINIAAPTISVHSGTRHYSSSATSLNQTLDFASILKASQALSSTIELDELLCQLTQIILQNSGGDRCALILPNETGDWQVRAIATPDEVQLCAESLTNNLPLPVKLVRYVKNTQEVVVIDDLETDLPVVDDYLRQQQPRSLLGLPILNQGRCIGILYLKNHLASGVFTSDRILILNFLCSQAAISLENARLYQNSQRALQTIQQQEAQYRGIFETVSDGLAIVNLETTQIVAANPAYCQMHGYTYEELLELKPIDVLRPQAYAKFEAFLESIRQGQNLACDVVCLQKDGRAFNAEIRSVPFHYNNQLCGLTVFRDVTEQKQLESALQEKNQALQQALRDLQQAQLQIVQSEKMSALGNLVAGVAHEINNPVGCIIGNVDIARDYIDDLLGLLALYARQFPEPGTDIKKEIDAIDLAYVREDLPALIRAMEDSGERIKSISNSLRTFSRADTKTKQTFDLHEGIDSTVLILQHRLKANEHRPAVEVVTDYGDIPYINCFPGQLNQVFMNILANAIDALDEASQSRSFSDMEAHPQRITIRTEREGHWVKVAIADNGPGIPDDTKARIFEYLFTTKDIGKGTGLGLAIAHQVVVETHGGSLDVRSEVSQGTEFCIRLPL